MTPSTLSTAAAAFAFVIAGCSAADGELGTTGEDGALTLRGFEEPSASDAAHALEVHGNVDPNEVVPRDLLGNALAFFDMNASRLDNTRWVTVVDFARHSGKKRFFMIDMETGTVESHVVAHGSGSDPDNDGRATRFGNTEGSNMSSLGYYVTAETYQGRHGYSLRLDGVSSTNSHARARNVVVHGADYVDPGRSQQGRSEGCLALPSDEVAAVIRALRGGSVIYAERSGMLE